MADSQLMIENAEVLFRNFAGLPSQYNPPGSRNFVVKLDRDVADAMIKDGWSVGTLKPRDEGDEPEPMVRVTVKYTNRLGQPVKRPPQIVMITSRGRNTIPEELVDTLDWVDIKQVDLVIRPFHWTMHEGTAMEKRGISAYLKSFYVTIEEDPLELKYADIPEIGAPARAIETATGNVIDVESWEIPTPKELEAGATPPWDED